MLPIVYHPDYVTPLPPGHRFPMAKFGKVYEWLVRDGIAELETKFGLAAGSAGVIVLGDTPLDIDAAHLAGARALGVGTGRYSPEQLREAGAEFALADLGNTPEVLKILLG